MPQSARDGRAVRPRSPRLMLGVAISVINEAELLGAVTSAVEDRVPTVFVGLYAALFRMLDRDPGYRALVARSATYPDGAGVVRELGKRGVPGATRLATTDVVHPLARLAASRAWRVGLYGAAAGVAERAALAIAGTTPGVEIVAIWNGYAGGPTVIELRQLQLDVILVALGAPQQERWAYEVAVDAGIPAVLTCGGLFDFLAGDKRRAPAWVQRAGFEWVFRVALEPRRLIARYLRGNLYFLRHARAERHRATRAHGE